jgi:hypothetical protein
MTSDYLKEVAKQIKSKNLTEQEAKLLKDKVVLAYMTLRKDFDFDFDRLRKKGPDMAVVQHAQSGVKTGGNRSVLILLIKMPRSHRIFTE